MLINIQSGLLAGLWQFPTVRIEVPITPKLRLSSAKAEVRRLLPHMSDAATLEGLFVGEFLHLFSHIRQTNHVVRIRLKSCDRHQDAHKNLKWVKSKDFAEVK